MKTRYAVILLILILPALIPPAMAQEVSKSKPVFGVRFTTGFTTEVKKYIVDNVYSKNYRVLHFIPAFTVDFRNSSFYLGPEYAYFIPPEPSGSINYNNNGWGVNLGYRLNSKEFSGNLRIFGQFNYSFYQIRSIHAYHGGMNSFDKKLFYSEHNVAIGLDYRIGRSIHLFSGLGLSLIGSTDNTSDFIELEPFVPTVFLGIDYKLGLSGEK